MGGKSWDTVRTVTPVEPATGAGKAKVREGDQPERECPVPGPPQSSLLFSLGSLRRQQISTPGTVRAPSARERVPGLLRWCHYDC